MSAQVFQDLHDGRTWSVDRRRVSSLSVQHPDVAVLCPRFSTRYEHAPPTHHVSRGLVVPSQRDTRSRRVKILGDVSVESLGRSSLAQMLRRCANGSSGIESLGRLLAKVKGRLAHSIVGLCSNRERSVTECSKYVRDWGGLASAS